MQDALSPKQLEVLAHLAAGLTVTRAARKASIHRSTIYLWLKQCPAYRAALETHLNIFSEAMTDRLRELHLQAIDALEDSLCGPESTPAVRLRAALYILEGSGAQSPLDKNRRLRNSAPQANPPPSGVSWEGSSE